MARADKTAAVAELAEEFRRSNAVVLTEYRGLTVKQLTTLRRSLGTSAKYAVVKNTLTALAAKDAGIEGLDQHLAGPSAIAFVTGDPVEAAKGLRDFARTHPLLVVKGGVLDGRAVSPDEIRALADLESREVLLAKLAGAMKASLSNAVALFAAPLAQTARVVEALRAKVEQESPAGDPEPADEAPADSAAVAAAPTESAPGDEAAASVSAPADEAAPSESTPADEATPRESGPEA